MQVLPAHALCCYKLLEEEPPAPARRATGRAGGAAEAGGCAWGSGRAVRGCTRVARGGAPPSAPPSPTPEPLQGCIECGRVDTALKVFEQLQEAGVQPNGFTHHQLVDASVVLGACVCWVLPLLLRMLGLCVGQDRVGRQALPWTAAGWWHARLTGGLLAGPPSPPRCHSSLLTAAGFDYYATSGRTQRLLSFVVSFLFPRQGMCPA